MKIQKPKIEPAEVVVPVTGVNDLPFAYLKFIPGRYAPVKKYVAMTVTLWVMS